MKQSFATLALGLVLAFAASGAQAWNGAGHRLIAAIAWRQMSLPAQQSATALLRRHPDYSRWTARARERADYNVFVEAATWPDDIRSDKRFSDDGRETPHFPGMPDTARHKDWHYVDVLPSGQTRDGALDQQLERLIRRLAAPGTPAEEKAYALPWVIHLVGDIHQPLHVGSRDDEGGNEFEVENPLNPRLPFSNLHTWWDDLPGPPWLRGARLEKIVDAILANHPQPPRQGNVLTWKNESLDIGRTAAYPTAVGSLLPAITPEFLAQSRAITNRRVADAGYRLGRLLESIFGRVPRETE